MKRIEEFFKKHIPLSNAESWDNVGLLIPSNKDDKSNRFLLTIDFTELVFMECLEKNFKKVISYHPVLFHPQKKINLFTTRIIENNISIFSPHTALDFLMNNIFLRKLECTDIEAVGKTAVGNNTKSINELVKMIKDICDIKTMRVSFLETHTMKTAPKKIYVGVGSGQFDDVEGSLLITGEMSHHEILKFRKSNSLILLEHCRSERWFLQNLKEAIMEVISGIEIDLSEYDRSPIVFL